MFKTRPARIKKKLNKNKKIQLLSLHLTAKQKVRCSIWQLRKFQLPIHFLQTTVEMYNDSSSIFCWQPNEEKMANYCPLLWGTTGYDKCCRHISSSLKCVVTVLNISIWKYANFEKYQCQRNIGLLQHQV